MEVQRKTRYQRKTERKSRPPLKTFPDVVQRILDLHSQGLDNKNIGREVGWSHASINRFLFARGLPSNGRRFYKPEELQTVRTMRASGCTIREITDALPNRSFRSVRTICRRRRFMATFRGRKARQNRG